MDHEGRELMPVASARVCRRPQGTMGEHEPPKFTAAACT